VLSRAGLWSVQHTHLAPCLGLIGLHLDLAGRRRTKPLWRPAGLSGRSNPNRECDAAHEHRQSSPHKHRPLPFDISGDHLFVGGGGGPAGTGMVGAIAVVMYPTLDRLESMPKNRKIFSMCSAPRLIQNS